MELDERKEKILKAIIQNYLETGEPVGSRTISKYSDSVRRRFEMRCRIWKNWDISFSRTHRQAGFLQIKDIVSMWIS